MKPWKVWLLVAVIFSTGALAGAFGMRAYMARNLPQLLADTRKRLEDHLLESIDREVGLSEAQKQSILPILKDAVRKGDTIHASVREQMDKVRLEADDRVSSELNPEQRVKFAEFRARMDKMRHLGPPPGPGMPPGPPPGFPPGPPPGPPPEHAPGPPPAGGTAPASAQPK
ncbi:MAG TPA: hypothetical protein VN419_00485 [Humidesulfovibrio sp.]|uniref:hypothetical protein n=1 Tax=Humidesulfovibrio sp. TaxID=2910988 RepID=UPI002C24126A|nr:hypothetical protein [Humidesulfovibrio sp.]HWR02464.1 hypothetical protein [Humidesulfovibrio sp.]